MDGFKFRREKNKFICEGHNLRIEYSNPKIQGFNELSSIKEDNSILYYYYTIKVYKYEFSRYVDEDDFDNDEEIWKWKKVFERTTYDFPGILWLKNSINYILNNVKKEDCQKIELRDNYGFEYRYSLSNTTFIANDDIYELSKIIHYNNNISYILFIGGSWDMQGDMLGCGIRCPYLNEKDLLELKKCVDSFIEYSKELQTKDNLKYTKMCNNSFFVKDNKLYSYLRDYAHRKVDKKALEEVFIVEDIIVDVVESIFNEDGTFYTKEYKKTKIIEINKDEIKLLNNISIPISNIQAIYDDYKNCDRIYYNVNQIAKDFINIMSKDEIEEFKTKNEEFLFIKYKMLFINRYFMCLKEHKFKRIIKDDNVLNAEIYVKKVIDILKKELKGEI